MTFVAGCSPSPTVAASTTFAAGACDGSVVAEDPPERACVDDRRDLDIDLVAALGELTPRQREVVILRFVADLPLEDVASCNAYSWQSPTPRVSDGQAAAEAVDGLAHDRRFVAVQLATGHR